MTYLFSKYGDLEIVVLNSKNTGAIIEYKNLSDALKVLSDEDNLNKKYSISVTWLGPPIQKNNVDDNFTVNDDSRSNHEHSHLLFEDMEAAILKKLQSN